MRQKIEKKNKKNTRLHLIYIRLIYFVCAFTGRIPVNDCCCKCYRVFAINVCILVVIRVQKSQKNCVALE